MKTHSALPADLCGRLFPLKSPHDCKTVTERRSPYKRLHSRRDRADGAHLNVIFDEHVGVWGAERCLRCLIQCREVKIQSGGDATWCNGSVPAPGSAGESVCVFKKCSQPQTVRTRWNEHGETKPSSGSRRSRRSWMCWPNAAPSPTTFTQNWTELLNVFSLWSQFYTRG